MLMLMFVVIFVFVVIFHEMSKYAVLGTHFSCEGCLVSDSE